MKQLPRRMLSVFLVSVLTLCSAPQTPDSLRLLASPATVNAVHVTPDSITAKTTVLASGYSNYSNSTLKNTSITWSITSDGLLSIKGTGEAYLDFSDVEKEIKDVVKRIEVSGDITIVNYYKPAQESGVFMYFQNVEEVNVTAPVESFGYGAFYNMTKLKKVSFGKSLKSISDHTFELCSALETLEMPDTVTYIGENAFLRCSALKEIHLSDSLTKIGQYAFYNCNQLKNISLPASLTSIGWGAFSLSGITSITIPGKVTSITNDAFSACPDLTTVKIEDGVTGINGFAFQKCESLRTLTLPETLVTVKEGAFRYCNSLENVVIPASVKSIEKSAFYSCKELKTLTLLGSDTALPDDDIIVSNRLEDDNPVFDGTVIGHKGSTAETYAKKYNITFEEIIDVPTEDKCGENLTFKYDKNKYQLTIEGSGDMTNFETASDVPWYSFRDRILFVSLPLDMTSVGDHAFSGTGIHSISIPNSVKRIGKNAFASCTNLETVEMSDSVSEIGALAFGLDLKLKELKCPDCLSEIGTQAFALSGIERFTVPETVTSIASNAFFCCSNLDYITIMNPDCEIDGSMSTISSQLIETGDPKKQFSGTILCYAGSTAEAYAEKNNCNYLYMKFPVDYNANGGTGKVPEGSLYQVIEFPECTLTAPEGMDFLGWRVGDKIYQPGDKLVLKDSATVYAEWGYSVNIIKLDLNGGTGDDVRLRVFKYTVYTLPECPYLAPEGQIFTGWGIKDVADKVLQPGETMEITEDTVFIPLWAPIEYAVSYNANEGTGEMTGKKLKPNEEYTLVKCTFTAPKDSTFLGWKIAGSEDETLYQPGDTVTIKADTEFLAVWSKPVVKVTLGDVNGDNVVDSADAGLLTRFVNGWEGITVNMQAADLNQDGIVSTVDAMILTRFVNNWDGYDTYIIQVEAKEG